MASEINQDPYLNLALRELVGNGFGGDWNIERKAKTLNKFGRNTAIGTSRALLWENGPAFETLRDIDSNVLDTFSSSDAGDVGQTVAIEGHYGDGSSNLVFVRQTIVSNGRNKVTLGTPLSRCSRMQVLTGTTVAAGDMWVYEDTALTNGVPTDLTKTANVIKGTDGELQSFKAQTSVSGLDALIVTRGQVSIAKKTSGAADVRLEVRAPNADFFLPVTGLVSLNTTGTTTIIVPLMPYAVVPPNSDIRVVAVGSTANLQVAGTFSGVLADRSAIPS